MSLEESWQVKQYRQTLRDAKLYRKIKPTPKLPIDMGKCGHTRWCHANTTDGSTFCTYICDDMENSKRITCECKRFKERRI